MRSFSHNSCAEHRRFVANVKCQTACCALSNELVSTAKRLNANYGAAQRAESSADFTRKLQLVGLHQRLGIERLLRRLAVETSSFDNAGAVATILIDRFKLKTHSESREVTVYAMLPAKGDPKIKKAEPTDRAGCKRGPGPPNGNGTSTIMETCLNTTMADLAKNLSQWAPGYFDHPVFDATGLTGGWNFSLVWTGRGQLLGDLAPKAGAEAGAAADPGGASAFEAVEKQLGFKLQSQKRLMPVIVIDHVEKP